VNATSLANNFQLMFAEENENSHQFVQDMSSEIYTRAYEHESITTTGQFSGKITEKTMGKTMSNISPVLGTATAIVAGDITGAATVYLDSLRSKLNLVSHTFYEKIIPALMPYIPNGRYELVSSKGTTITIKSKIKSGDSAGSILSEWFSMPVLLELVKRSKNVHPLTSLRVGRSYFITLDTASDRLSRFEYEIDNTDRLVINFTGLDYDVFSEAIPYELELAYVEGNIQMNFFDSVLSAGENANFAIKLADVFSYDIDFIHDIQNEDTFYALVEKRYREGEFKGYGRIIGAKFINDGHTHSAYLFHDASHKKRLTYFDEKGKALQKAFLRSPVHFTRVSSKFSMSRKHPILGITRPHQGIDYAAPRGTPVVAVGDGTVTRSAYTGGYGNLIVLRHVGGLESQYGHLSGYAKGIKKGTKVSQGQTIGFVGSTGLSTGPHLDFRIKKNKRFVNPDKVIVPNKAPITQEQKPFFELTVKEVEAYMSSKKKRAQFDDTRWLKGAR